MTAVGLRQQGSEAVGPRSNLCRIRYFHYFTGSYQKFHFNGSHGTVGRTTWFWSGCSGFESLSCQILKWFHWHLTQIPMVPMAQSVGQQSFAAVDTGLSPAFTDIFKLKNYDGKSWYLALMHENFSIHQIFWNTEEFPNKIFRHCETKNFQRKIVILFCIKYRNQWWNLCL